MVELRQIAGLGINMTEVYSFRCSHLKGIFHVTESFRSDRDPDGWRMPATQTQFAHHETEDQEDAALKVAMETTATARADYPEFTTPMYDLGLHVDTLFKLVSEDTPPSIHIRPSITGRFHYYIRDASAEGFGGVTQYPDGML